MLIYARVGLTLSISSSPKGRETVSCGCFVMVMNLSDKIAFQCPAIIHLIVQIIRRFYCVFNSADVRTVREKETSFNVM